MRVKLPKEVLDAWPNCAVPDCQNKVCCRFESIYCYPHTFGLPMDAEGNVIHIKNCPCPDCQEKEPLKAN